MGLDAAACAGLSAERDGFGPVIAAPRPFPGLRFALPLAEVRGGLG